ncbi:MAG: glycosyltransferase family 2 protein [Lachnospiraceae bacterium]|nr:glycosyltransferase family 2 protein [Lachnospiraceae bacterium]
MKATVLFLSYNNFDEAAVTVDSLMKQSWRDAEIVLSDDASTEDHAGLIYAAAERLRTHFKNVRVNINETNMGTVAHMNKLFKQIDSGCIIFCSPGDAFPHEDTLANIVKRFERGGELVLTGQRTDIYPDRKKTRPGAVVGLALKLCPKLLMNYMIRKHNLISSCCTAYTTKLFEQYGYLDEDYRLLDDFPFIISLLQRNVRIGWTDEVFLEHSIGGGVSTGSAIHPVILEDLLTMLRKLRDNPAGLSRRTLRSINSRLK